MLSLGKIFAKLQTNMEYIPATVQGVTSSLSKIDEKLNIVKIYKYLALVMLKGDFYRDDNYKINSDEIVIKDVAGELIICKCKIFVKFENLQIHFTHTKDFSYKEHGERINTFIWRKFLSKIVFNDDHYYFLCENFYNTTDENYKVRLIAELSDYIYNLVQNQNVVLLESREVDVFAENEQIIIMKKLKQKEHSIKCDLSERELSLVQKLSDDHVPSEIEISLVREIYETWDKEKEKIDVILLEGPAGSGKTEIAKAISHHLNLPYRKITCSSNTEEMNLTGAIMPRLDENNETYEKFYNTLGKEAKINFENISKVFEIPSLAEVTILKDKVEKFLNEYFKECKTYDENERYAKIIEIYDHYFEALSNSSKKEVGYTFVESQFVEALKRPGVFEIQEPASIKDEGVLQILNSVLEYDGLLELPNFKQIKKHKDCIVIFTTNRGYAGNRPLNQALRDRAKIAFYVNLPSVDEMVDRVSKICKITKEEELVLLKEMAILIKELRYEMHEEGIKGGELGMRSFIEWVRSFKRGNTLSKSFAYCCAYKITTEIEDLKYIEDKCKNMSSIFNDDILSLV